MDLVGETGTGILVIHAHIEVNLCFLRNIKETFASKHEVRVNLSDRKLITEGFDDAL